MPQQRYVNRGTVKSAYEICCPMQQNIFPLTSHVFFFVVVAGGGGGGGGGHNYWWIKLRESTL